MNLVELVEQPYLKNDIPAFRVGDTVKVHVKIIEGDKERVQVYEGVVIARKGRGLTETFTVRRVAYGVGIERTFPVHSPQIDKIEISVVGKYVVQNCIIFVKEPGKQRELKNFINNQEKAQRCGKLFTALFNLFYGHVRFRKYFFLRFGEGSSDGSFHKIML